jgi:hypothetical protein
MCGDNWLRGQSQFVNSLYRLINGAEYNIQAVRLVYRQILATGILTVICFYVVSVRLVTMAPVTIFRMLLSQQMAEIVIM